MLKSAIKFYCFVSPDFMSRPFCSHVATLQDGASSGVFFVNNLASPLADFKTNVIKWKLHFLSCNFGLKSNLLLQIALIVITRLISDQIALHSVQLPLLI